MKFRLSHIILSLVFFNCIILNLTGQQLQERYLNFSGVVMESDSLKPLVDVYYSLNGKLSGISDNEGKFSIYAKVGDTLFFSHVGYRNRTFKISDSLKQDNYLLGILLTRDTIRLREVLIFPRLRSLRQEMTNFSDDNIDNKIAKRNLDIATYQGLKSEPDLTNPETSHHFQSLKLQREAMEKGGIPSDKMVSVNVFTGVALIMSFLLNNEPEIQKPATLPTKKETDWLKNYFLNELVKLSPPDSTGVMQK